jgi:hypothetical protein
MPASRDLQLGTQLLLAVVLQWLLVKTLLHLPTQHLVMLVLSSSSSSSLMLVLASSRGHKMVGSHQLQMPSFPLVLSASSWELWSKPLCRTMSLLC